MVLYRRANERVDVFMITCLTHENHVTPKSHIGIFMYLIAYNIDEM